MPTIRAYLGHVINGIYDEIGRNNPSFYDRLMPTGEAWADRRWSCVGLVFSVRVWAELGDAKAGSVLHLIVAGNAVHVWKAEHESWDAMSVPMEDWINTSNHDSCWKSAVDEAVTDIYFRLCDEVQKDLPEEQKVAPADVYVYADVGFIHLFHWVRCTFKQDPEDRHNYKVKLTALEKIKMRCIEVHEKEE